MKAKTAPLFVKMLTARSHILAVECRTSDEAQAVAKWGKRSGMAKVKIQSTQPLSTKTLFVDLKSLRELPADWRYEIEEDKLLGEHNG